MKQKILIAHFKNYIASKKILWKGLTNARKIDFIERAFARDLEFRSEVRGLVIGHIKLEEYHQYKLIARDSNKRINYMIKERIISHLNTLSP
jgi:UDP-2,3-diacylglucosamine pyrophosphatase LpxH